MNTSKSDHPEMSFSRDMDEELFLDDKVSYQVGEKIYQAKVCITYRYTPEVVTIRLHSDGLTRHVYRSNITLIAHNEKKISSLWS